MLQLDFRKKKNGVPILSQNEIDTNAELLLIDYDPSLLEEPASLDIEWFSESYIGLEMDFKDLTPDQKVLGAMVFTDGNMPVYDLENSGWKPIPVEEGTVIIDNSLLNPDQLRRGRFTLGHEIGHWLYHRHMYVINKSQMSLFEVEPQNCKSYIKCRFTDIENPRKWLETDDDWMEWHADYMASALLMPRTTFKKAAYQMLRQVGLETNYYKLGTDFDLDVWVDSLATNLADIFEVSITAAAIRLKKLGIIVESKTESQLQFDNTV